MSWMAEIFTEPTYVQAALLISMICAVGLIFGQLKFKV